MKKIIKLSLIVFIGIIISFCNVKNVYAVSSCKADLTIEKSEYKKDDDIVAYVRIYDIQSELGIFTGMMTLEYDKNCLELLNMEGQNSWDTPISGVSYNSANGKIVITRTGFAQNAENILKIIFKAIGNNTNVNIGLKNIFFSDSNLIKLENISRNINIIEENPVVSELPKSEETNSDNSETEEIKPETQEQQEEINEKNEPSESKSDNLIVDNSIVNDQEIKNPEEENIIEDKNTVYPVLNEDMLENSKTSEQTEKDDSVSSLKLPNTGQKNIILIVSIILFTICIIFVIYSGTKHIKNNKKDQ